MSEHLPKKLLDKLQNLQDHLQWVIDLPQKQKLGIANKKLMGAELNRILDELQQHPQAFLGDIAPPDVNDPKSIKTFLYAMQSGGRKARDKLNTVPKKLSPLNTQHHGAYGLGGVRPAFQGLNISQSLDRGLGIRDLTGTKPGSHTGNLWEILGRRDIHEGIGHGGSYNDPAQRMMLDSNTSLADIKDEVTRVFDLNTGRSNAAMDATKASGIPEVLDQLRIIGSFDDSHDLSQGNITEEGAAASRKAVTQGTKLLQQGTGIDVSTPKNFLELMLDEAGKFRVAEFAAAMNNPAGRRAAGVLPILGTGAGAAFVEKNADDRDKEIEQNPDDWSLKINKALDQASGWADRATLGSGGWAGPVTEPVSLATGLTSLAIDGGRAVLKSIAHPDTVARRKALERAEKLRHADNINARPSKGSVGWPIGGGM